MGLFISICGFSFQYVASHFNMGLLISICGFSFQYVASHFNMGLLISIWGFSFQYWASHFNMGLLISILGFSFQYGASHFNMGLLISIWDFSFQYGTSHFWMGFSFQYWASHIRVSSVIVCCIADLIFFILPTKPNAASFTGKYLRYEMHFIRSMGKNLIHLLMLCVRPLQTEIRRTQISVRERFITTIKKIRQMVTCISGIIICGINCFWYGYRLLLITYFSILFEKKVIYCH